MKEELKKIPKRILALVNKLIGVKGLCLGIGLVLKLDNKLEDYAFLIIIGIVIFGREIFKYIPLLRK